MEVLSKLVELLLANFESVLYYLFLFIILWSLASYASKKRAQRINMIRKCTACDYIGKASLKRRNTDFLDLIVMIFFFILCFATWYFCINASTFIYIIVLLSITVLFLIYLKWSYSELIECPDCGKINSMIPADATKEL